VADLDPARPTAAQLLGRRLVLWRDGGGAWRAMADQCPHRLAPLSGARPARPPRTALASRAGLLMRMHGADKRITGSRTPACAHAHAPCTGADAFSMTKGCSGGSTSIGGALALAEGRIEPSDGTLMCSYHGWRFAGDGACTSIPQAADQRAEAAALASPRSCALVHPAQARLLRADAVPLVYLLPPAFLADVRSGFNVAQ